MVIRLTWTSREAYDSNGRTREFYFAVIREKVAIVISALRARSNFGKLLRLVEDEHRSLFIEKRGVPKAVLLSIRDYVRLAAPEPDVLRAIGEKSQRKGTDKLTSRQIDRVIQSARAGKIKRG
jgi:prevent-host-death family protein